MVVIEHPQIKGGWARLITNHAHAMRVQIRAPRGLFTPAMIEKIGLTPDIREQGDEHEIIFWLQRMEQIDPAQFERLVRESIAGLSKTNGESS